MSILNIIRRAHSRGHYQRHFCVLIYFTRVRGNDLLCRGGKVSQYRPTFNMEYKALLPLSGKMS